MRNRWYHESSEVHSKIRVSDLEHLALAVQVFAVDFDLKMECESILSGAKEGNVTDALFSLSWIARHLEQRSTRTNSYKVLQDELTKWKNDKSKLAKPNEDFERLNRLTRMLDHAYQALDFQYLFLMHSHHTYQKDLLDMLEEVLREKLDVESVSLLEKIKKYQFSSPVDFLTWEEHELDTIKSAFDLLEEFQGGDKCDCEYCAQIPAVMSPFTVEDNQRIDFLENILKRDNRLRIEKLFRSEY